MPKKEPTILGLTAAEVTELVRRATRQAALSDLRAGIPVIGMVDGEIRTLLPTDPAALRLLETHADSSDEN